MKNPNHSFVGCRRVDYSGKPLPDVSCAPHPYDMFREWFQDACDYPESKQPNAMTLATVDAQQKPHARIVLLKDFDQGNFVFYTNYDSAKGSELSECPVAALVFYWEFLHRQVRIEGVVTKLSHEKSAEYFASRPAKSQVSATISPQSQTIQDRSYLESLFKEFEETHEEPYVCPKFWGGFVVHAQMIEFWQGQSGRLHERLRYDCLGNDEWSARCLAP